VRKTAFFDAHRVKIFVHISIIIAQAPDKKQISGDFIRTGLIRMDFLQPEALADFLKSGRSMAVEKNPLRSSKQGALSR